MLIIDTQINCVNIIIIGVPEPPVWCQIKALTFWQGIVHEVQYKLYPLPVVKNGSRYVRNRQLNMFWNISRSNTGDNNAQT